MKTKRILSVILALICLAGFSACTNKSSSEQTSDDNTADSADSKTSAIEVSEPVDLEALGIPSVEEENELKTKRGMPQACNYSYHDLIRQGKADGRMRRITLQEMKDIIAQIDLKKELENYWVKYNASEDERILSLHSLNWFGDFVYEKIIEKICEIQPCNDFIDNGISNGPTIVYWPDALTEAQRREEIVLVLSGLKTLYKTFDENGDMINQEVLFDYYGEMAKLTDELPMTEQIKEALLQRDPESFEHL